MLIDNERCHEKSHFFQNYHCVSSFCPFLVAGQLFSWEVTRGIFLVKKRFLSMTLIPFLSQCRYCTN